jgi:hypothetical protein
MTTQAAAVLGRKSVIAVISFVALVLFLAYAKASRESFPWAVGRTLYVVLTALLVTRLRSTQTFDRNAAAMWLCGFGCIAALTMAAIRTDETRDKVFPLVGLLAVLIGIPLLVTAYRTAQQSNAAPQREGMLTGAGIAAIALIVQVLENSCSSNCIHWGDFDVSVPTGLFLMGFAAFVVMSEWRDARNETAEAGFAVVAILAAVSHLQPRLASLLWLTATLMVTYDVHRRIREGSIVSSFVAPERLWSGFGVLVPIGIAVCIASAFAQWHPEDAMAAPGPFALQMVMGSLAIFAFLLVPFVMMMKAPNFRPARNAVAILFTLLPALWWLWVGRTYYTLDGERISLVQRGPIVYAVGAILIIGGITAAALMEEARPGSR